MRRSSVAEKGLPRITWLNANPSFAAALPEVADPRTWAKAFIGDLPAAPRSCPPSEAPPVNSPAPARHICALMSIRFNSTSNSPDEPNGARTSVLTDNYVGFHPRSRIGTAHREADSDQRRHGQLHALDSNPLVRSPAAWYKEAR